MKMVDEIYREMLACFGARTGLEPREGSGRPFHRQRKGSIWTATPSCAAWSANRRPRRRGLSGLPPGRSLTHPGISPGGRYV